MFLRTRRIIITRQPMILIIKIVGSTRADRSRAEGRAALTVQKPIHDEAAAGVAGRVPANESIDLVHTGLLVVMDPFDSVVRRQGLHGLGKLVRIWHDEVVEDGDDVAVGLQSAVDFLMDPISVFVVAEATV